jgi:hypothetical protein
MNGAAMISRKPTRDKLTRLLGLVIVLSFSAACGTFQLRMGNRPDINLLENSLHLGESTRAEVLATLGEPIGRGMARLPVDPRPNAGAMWSYYYEEDLVKGILSQQPSVDGRRMFLFIVFEGDTYDGYMWFSSLPKVTP